MNTRTRGALFGLVTVAWFLTIAYPAVAQMGLTPLERDQSHPDNAKGFSAEKVFQFGEVDSINVFNGNVVVQIPLGQRFSVDDHLSYQFGLTWNAKNWDYKHQPDAELPFIEALPTWRANAGFGWLFSLGRLIAPGEDPIAHNTEYIYESPDGADYRFGETFGGSSIWMTAGSVRLRMRLAADGTRTVEFPDGTIRTFSSHQERWRLTKISDRFGNDVTISYHDNGSFFEIWTITDRNRTSRAVFLKDDTQTFDNYKKRLISLELGAFGGAPAATYSFEYVTAPVYRGCQSTGSNGNGYLPLPLLTRIVPPTGPAWSFDYYTDQATDCSEGLIQRITYPTGGRVEYVYQKYSHSSTECGVRVGKTPGIREKRLLDRNNVKQNATTYTLSEGPLKVVEICSSSPTGESGDHPRRSSEWVMNTVTTHEVAGTTSTPIQSIQNYFSAWVAPPGSHPQVGESSFSTTFDEFDYGLPLIRYAPPEHEASVPISYAVDGETRLLSSKTYVYVGGIRQLARVRYSTHGCFDSPYCGWPGSPKLLSGSRSVNYDDPLIPYVDTAYADYDGFGNFRRTTTTSNLSAVPNAKRVQYTGYNKGPFDVATHPNRPWILNTFDRTSLEDLVWDNGSYRRLATHQTFALNPTNGLVTSRRVHRPSSASVDSIPAPAGGDIVTSFSYDIGGRVTNVHKSGGDGTAAGSVYDVAISHSTLSNGYRRLVQTVTPEWTLTISDEEFDKTTGLTSVSRDSAGVATAFYYDLLGRLTDVTPTGAARTHYAYSYVSGQPKVDVTVQASGSSELLGSEQYFFDSFGRVVEKQWKMPDGSWPNQRVTFNGLGWKTSEDNAGGITRYENFDSFGRVGTIVAPDSSRTTIAFTGTRRLETTVELGANQLSRKREDYDHLGRLVSVTELASTDPAVTLDAAGVRTTYSYGLGDRLSRVCQNDVNGLCGQQRVFQFDARGFLAQETHPESGSTIYENYDAGGHAWTKRKPAPSVFDLQFTYDKAERLTLVGARNPYYLDQFRPLKSFSFGTVNQGANLVNGKLASASRHNYITFLGDVTVTEEHTYDDLAGRRTKRTTWIENITYGRLLQVLKQEVEYDDLGNVKSETYPVCDWEGCTSSLSKWTKVGRAYSLGRLTSMTSMAAQTLPIVMVQNYHATGIPTQFEHGNGIRETIAIDPSGMARPSRITFSPSTPCSAPEIWRQPQGAIIPQGSTATLMVGASSAEGSFLRYQWFDDVGPILNATQPTFTTPPLTQNQTYYARVMSWCGVTDSTGVEIGRGGLFSAFAAIEVLACSGPPSITTHPTGAAVPNGGAATLSVTATGTVPLVYQWYEGTPGTTTLPVAGGTSSTLSLTGLTSTNSYWVRVTNDCGHVDSVSATVTVFACSVAPAVATQPANQSVPGGQSATLSVVASGIGPFTYQWYLGAAGSTTSPVGTSSSTYTTPAMNSSAQYWVRLTNSCGYVDSTAATVTVTAFAPPARRQRGTGVTMSNNYAGASWPSPTLSGSLLLAFVSTSTVVSVTPAAGWQLVGYTGFKPRLYVYAIENASVTSGYLQFNLGGYTRATMTLVEYTGIAASGSFDKMATASGSGATASSGTTAVTSQPSELAVSFVGALSSTFGPASNGFSEVAELGEIGVVHDRILTSAGTYGHTCPRTGTSAWYGMVLTFRAKQLP